VEIIVNSRLELPKKCGLDKSSPYNLFIRSDYLFDLKGGFDKSSPYKI